MEHEFKCWPDSFAAVLAGAKPFEWRNLVDRDVRVGDTLRLREWGPMSCAYTGRECRRVVTYVMPIAQLPCFTILGIAEVPA